jgi:ribonucleoside-diphosphate reductase alpha chain
MTAFQTPISHRIWATKYRLQEDDGAPEPSIEVTWRRVARTLAAEEPDATLWEDRFYHTLEDFRFLPGGRILAGAGSGHSVTLFNCFVMGPIEDSMDGIFTALREGALTMQAGGGVGYDFSTLRPAGTRARRTGNVASGPVSFMRIWDATCATLLSTGARRGAMMATLRCDHPDILEFIKAKHDARELRNFNLSVLVSDAFMAAVDRDDEWPLVFPAVDIYGDGETLMRQWSGGRLPEPCRVMRRLRARDLWRQIMLSNYDYAEPGVLFIDRINQRNNLNYCEQISATNPCGEIPLPPYGACNLGAINLTRFVRAPFSPAATLDLDAVAATAAVAVRMLDNVVEASRFAIAAQRESARRTRRLGLGFTGLADTLIMLGLRYDADAGRALAATAMARIREAAYRASIRLAEEKGAFPAYDSEGFLRCAELESLPDSIRAGLARHGIRNSHLTAIAPCGTISLLANNVSSGIEPVFAFHYRRRVRTEEGGWEESDLEDYAWRLWRQQSPVEQPPDSFVTAQELRPADHLAMQAAVQPHIDSAISKTINVPETISFKDFETLYHEAYRLGLKGCTCFRPNPVTGAILSEQGTESDRQCCTVDREAD